MTALDVLVDLERQSIERPGALALQETSGRRMTFAELHARIRTVAGSLLAEGMRPAERVLFTVPPGIDSIVLILAIVQAGGVVVAANPLMGPELFASRIRLMEPSWVMASTLVYWLGRIRRPAFLRGLPLLPDLRAVPARHFVSVGPPLLGGPATIAMRSLLRAGRSTDPAVPRPPDDPVVIVFTSGTTAAPRAVVHTNASIGAALDIMSREARFEPGDVLYTDQLHLILPALRAGVPTVIPRGRFRAARLLEHLRRYRISHTFGVPSEYQELVEYASSHHLSLPASLRKVLLGSAAVPATFLRRLVPLLSTRTRVTCVYGMTEAIPVCLIDLEAKLEYRGEGDLVGAPVAGVTIRTAADGELIVRGPNVCRGYWGHEPIAELSTGDLGRLDANGNVVLIGRKKTMIIRGQENIYPELFESTITGIAGVRRCCLVGLYRDREADEQVILCVEPDPGIDETTLPPRVMRELRDGPHRIGAAALPDRIVLMPIPLSVRSRKVDRSAVVAALRGVSSPVAGPPPC
jgi:acyl-CoA synthetase (AMP-forming)/AMP-acid ligase II